MKSTRFLTLAVLGMGMSLIGCGGGLGKLPIGSVAQNTKLYEKPILLRFKRKINEIDRYKAKHSIVTDGITSGSDDTEMEIRYSTRGKVKSNDKLDRVLIGVHQHKHSSMIKGSNGVVRRSKNVKAAFQPKFTPNTAAEPNMGGVRYIPIDSRGVVALRKSTPFHWAMRDSLYFLFPMLPNKAVSIGDTWTHKLPVTTELLFDNNDFELSVEFTLNAIENVEYAPLQRADCAIISYIFYGSLDTDIQQDRDKLAKSGLLHRSHIVEGKGTAYFDVKRGKLVIKKEQYLITSKAILPNMTTRNRSSRRKSSSLEPITQIISHEVSFFSRLLAPGEGMNDKRSKR